MKKFFALALLAAVSTAGAQTLLLDEDFESYADTTAMEAVWTPSAAGTLVLTTDAGNAAEGSDKYLASPATAASLVRTFTETTPTDLDPIALTYYTRAADWTNSRVSISVRDAAAGADLYMSIGTTNGIAGDLFAVRILGWTGLTGLTSSYATLANSPARATDEWVKLQLLGGETTFVARVNGAKADDDTITATGAPAVDAGSVKIGYGISSNVAVDYDSITVHSGDPDPSSVSDWELMF